MTYFTKERIRAIRNEQGESQERFAHLLGVSFATVNRWESGKSSPSQLAKKILRQLEEKLKNDEENTGE